jgi:hypothetical protein
MTKRPDFKNFKENALKDKMVQLEYERLRPEFKIIIKHIKANKLSLLSKKQPTTKKIVARTKTKKL